MITIQTPYVQFTDLDGSPLDDGAVYIGTAGLNPQTNPITVYWDNAGTQPAAQPLSTRSGVIARNGAPARVYISASSYSLMVRDKRGSLVASELSITSSVDASGITDGTITEVKLDAALVAKINGALQKTGGTMTGAITLPGNATNALEAVPKQQAESIAASYRGPLASIGVAVAGSAMTGTLQPEVIDFRSATLTSGAPVSRSATVAASLTVPSGARLGAVGGQSARIVWGWIDNAGTLEPFVVNPAGGVNLDETTLINTTTISASSDSAGVFYSTTARTGVAFRVRGYCDITPDSPGSWSASPTKVQGAGGLALPGIAFVRRWQSVTRNSGTIYYNTTGYEIVFRVAIQGDPGLSTSALVSIDGGSNIIVCQTNSSAGVNGLAAGEISIPPGSSYSPSYSNTTSVTCHELR